jgi:uncharacterized membrane protein
VSERPAGADAPQLSGPTSTGVDARLSALLCYVAWWVSGIVFLVIEQENREVRFHAAQSIVLFGGLSLVLMLTGMMTAGMLFISPAAFEVIYMISRLLGLLSILLWLFVIVKILNGESWKAPLAGDLAAKLVAR